MIVTIEPTERASAIKIHNSPRISTQTLARRSRVQTKASVIPKPARKMGVNPIRGLIFVPVNGATGVF